MNFLSPSQKYISVVAKKLGKNLWRRLARNPVFFLSLVGILVLAALPALYFFRQYQEVAQRLRNPAAVAREETRVLVGQVGKLMALPTGEDPTVMTVADRDKLKDQPFFVNAQNGDKVLLYTRAKKAILYRPAINKIIEVSPITIGQATGSAQAAAREITVELRNGTPVDELIGKYAVELKQKAPNTTVVATGSAKRKDYTISRLVNISGTRGDEAATLGKTLGLTVAALPAEETTTSAQFLIIIGADKE